MADKKKNILFVVFAYVFFWGFLAIIVALISAGVMDSEGTPMNIGIMIGSWTPTVSLLVLYKKLYPGSSVKNFYKNAFKERINWKMLSVVAIVQILIFIVAISIVTFINKVSLTSLLDFSLQTVSMGFFWTLIQGATGEESGWRGFLQPSLEKKFSVTKSSVIVGIIWGCWHMPLWLFSGYAGKELIQYSLLFLLWVIFATIIIGICYSRCRNLIVPIWIHFMFNFCMTVFTGDAIDALNVLTCITILYALAAVSYIVWNKKTCFA